MLLNVSRSLWSLSELGKRDLPPRANKLLAEMLLHVKTNESASKFSHRNAQHLKQQTERLEYLLSENEYQQLLVARKITVVEKKQATKLKLLPLVDFLKSKANGQKSATMLCQIMHAKAAKHNATDYVATLKEYELRQEVLKLEKILLQSQIQKILSSLEIKDADN